MTTSLTGTTLHLWVDHTGKVTGEWPASGATAVLTPHIEVTNDTGTTLATIWVKDLDTAEDLADVVASILEYYRDRSAQRLAAVGPPVTAAGKQASVQAIEGRWS